MSNPQNTRLLKACHGATKTKGGMNIPELRKTIKTKIPSDKWITTNIGKARRKELQEICDLHIIQRPTKPLITKPTPQTISINQDDFDMLYKLYEPIYHQHWSLQSTGQTNTPTFKKLDNFIKEFRRKWSGLYTTLTNIVVNSPYNMDYIIEPNRNTDFIIKRFMTAVLTIYEDNI